MAIVRYRNVYSVILVFFWFSLFTYITVCVRYRGYLQQDLHYKDGDSPRSEILGALTHEDEEDMGYDVILAAANQKTLGNKLPDSDAGTTRQSNIEHADQITLSNLKPKLVQLMVGDNLPRNPNYQQPSPQRPPPLSQQNSLIKPIVYDRVQTGHSPIRPAPLKQPAQFPLSNFTGYYRNQGVEHPLAPGGIDNGPPRVSLGVRKFPGVQKIEDSPRVGKSIENSPKEGESPGENQRAREGVAAGVLSEEQRMYDEQELFKPMTINPKTFSLSVTKNMIEHFQVTLPPLLPGYKNPCWLEDLSEDHSYEDSYYNQCNMFPGTGEQRFKAKFDLFERNVLRKRAKFGAHWRIRCFPYFFLLGMGKCGTTDLFITMKAYAKGLAPTFLKESHFWEWKRCQHTLHCRGKQRNPTLADYLDALDQPAERVRQEKVYTANGTEYHPLIIGDFTPSTLTFNPCWQRQPGNLGQDEPRYTTPHYIHSMRPQTRFIVILRDPVDRIFSNYKMKFRLSSGMQGENAQSFHDEMINATTYLLDCMKTKSPRACAYSVMRFDFMTHVSNSMYDVFIRDWLSVFPRDQFLFLRMEDYMENRVPHVKAILKFLDLNDLTPEQEAEVEAKQIVNQAPHTSEMYDVTRDLLRDFFRPFNTRLAELLGNEGFKWGY